MACELFVFRRKVIYYDIKLTAQKHADECRSVVVIQFYVDGRMHDRILIQYVRDDIRHVQSRSAESDLTDLDTLDVVDIADEVLFDHGYVAAAFEILLTDLRETHRRGAPVKQPGTDLLFYIRDHDTERRLSNVQSLGRLRESTFLIYSSYYFFLPEYIHCRFPLCVIFVISMFSLHCEYSAEMP